MAIRWIRNGALFAGLLLSAGVALGQDFPWQPVSPPLYQPPVQKPVEVPKIDPPSRTVPGHRSDYGFVTPYETDGPMPPPVAPGGTSKGWVPGHHNGKGAWVPLHPR
jgi:hypothetical protein